MLEKLEKYGKYMVYMCNMPKGRHKINIFNKYLTIRVIRNLTVLYYNRGK